jgi:transcriptional regulator with PAS, ATPase and Fis domain
VIAATNRQLAGRVEEGAFRRDLYYRINVVRIDLPPLSERREDIALLVEHFVARFNRLQDKNVHGVSDEAMRCLMGHEFAGNVRELENVIERAFVVCRSGLIEPEHLPADLHCRRSSGGGNGDGNPVRTRLRDIEAQMLSDALRRHHGNRSAAARELDIHPSTLYRKARSLGVELPATDGRHDATSA